MSQPADIIEEAPEVVRVHFPGMRPGRLLNHGSGVRWET